MTPAVGDLVNVGGAVGNITSITGEQVIVEGTYFYSAGSDDDMGCSEPWRMVFSLTNFKKFHNMWKLKNKRMESIYDT
jgi:hypothetical protein